MGCRLPSLLFIATVSYLCAADTPARQAVLERYNAQVHNLREKGAFAEAEKTALAAVAEAEKSGRQDAELAKSWNNLGALYYDTGRYAEAETLFRRSAELWEKLGGPEHAEYVQGLSNLAVLYLRTNRLKEAEPILLRALS